MNRQLHHYDFTGRLILVGDYIAYAASLGQSCVLGWGKVLECGRSKSSPMEWDESLQANTRPATLTVRALERRSWRVRDGIKVMEKLVTLQYPERCVVVEAAQVPADVVEALRF